MQAQAMSIKTAAKRLAISATVAYRLVKSGDIRTVRIGQRRFVTEEEVARILEVQS